MKVSAHMRMLIGFGLANIIIVVVAAVVLLNRPVTPPLIQGVLLPEGQALPAFSLIDHNNRPFTRENLQGRWHLVSYGFTTCPDICPTTLSQLVVVSGQLQTRGADLQVLFYTVDYRRDTVDQMAAYVPFFHEDFVGLTHKGSSDNPHLPFEQGLGIMAKLVPLLDTGAQPDANEYQVNHGVALFLINPEGELQAVFEPEKLPGGMHSFDPETIVRDYLAIRRFLG